MKKAREFILKIFQLLNRPEMRILPGQLAFFLVLTIIPMVALIITLAAALSLSTDVIRIAIEDTLPSQIASLIESIMVGNGMSLNLFVFFFSAFLLASNGTYSMINISNEIYKTDPRNFLKRRVKAIVMIFIMVGLFFFLLAVPVFGSTIFQIITQVIGESTFTQILHNGLVLLKYPIIIFILYSNIRLMYIIAPDEQIPPKTITKGTLFTTIGWILSTEIFAFYIETFAKYDLFYGSISNVLVLLLWVYLLSYIYVLGMIINASELKKEVITE